MMNAARVKTRYVPNSQGLASAEDHFKGRLCDTDRADDDPRHRAADRERRGSIGDDSEDPTIGDLLHRPCERHQPGSCDETAQAEQRHRQVPCRGILLDIQELQQGIVRSEDTGIDRRHSADEEQQ